MKLYKSILAILSILCLCEGSTEFTISGSGVSCSGDFEVDSLSIDCGGSYCTFGSEVNVAGSVTINNDLASETPTVKVVVANVQKIYEKEIDLCSVLSSNNGGACPSAGSYTLKSFKFKIPGDGESWYANNGYWGLSLSVKAIFDFGDSKTSCSTSVTLSKNNGYTMAAGAVAILGFAGALAGFSRRRKVGTIKLHEEEGTTSHFEMMPNEGACRV